MTTRAPRHRRIAPIPPSSPPPGRVDWADDRGQVGGIEVLPFSILIFVVGSLLVAQAWAAIDVKSAVNAASREATRAYVEAPDAITARTDAERVAREAIAGHGRDPARLTIEAPDLHGGGFSRCQEVTIRMSYPVPALTLPLLGNHGEAYRATSSHTEIIDPYRSGLTATGSC